MDSILVRECLCPSVRINIAPSRLQNPSCEDSEGPAHFSPYYRTYIIFSFYPAARPCPTQPILQDRKSICKTTTMFKTWSAVETFPAGTSNDLETAMHANRSGIPH